MIFSFSTIINMTIACCILTGILALLIRHNKMIAHFGTSLILGIIFLLMIRFLLPVEFSFTKTIYIYEIYPAIFLFLTDDFLTWGSLRFSICDALVIIWIIGSCLLFIRSIVQYIILTRAYSKCRQMDNPDILHTLKILNNEFSKKKSFRIVECPDIASPMIFGILHPYIVLPTLTLPNEEWYYILKHELTHYYHGHLIFKMLCEILCNLYWWNPAVYILRYFLKLIMEMDADAKATSDLSEANTLQYINCLAEIAKRQTKSKLSYEWSVTFISTPKTYLGKRSNYLLENIKHPKRFFLPAVIIGSIFSLFLLCSALFIFEPSNYKNVSFPNTWDFNDEGCFLLENSDNTYSLYVNWKYITDLPIAPDDDPYARIYNTLMEACKNENKK